MISAFVTGASGFTGGHLCRFLVGKGYEVRALFRSSESFKCSNLNQVTPVIGDLTDKESFNGVLTGIDVVFHIAAAFREETADKEVFYQVNVQGTKNVLNEALRAGVKKFIHCSTVGVHGEILSPPANENSPFNPSDRYQKSKLEGEKVALNFFKNSGINGVVFRPAGIYGPGDKRFRKVFKLVNSGFFIMVGRGNVQYQLTYIDDLLAGIIALAEKKTESASVYILAGKKAHTLNEIIEVLGKTINKKVRIIYLPIQPIYLTVSTFEWCSKLLNLRPILYKRRLDFFTKDRSFDISKAVTEIGYNPTINIEEGFRKTAISYGIIPSPD
ncbi:MAG: NAD-dependent epimerase/dehydratase family protein [Cyclobacteriaceae bacterium]